jgi:Lipopolysaccharide assembly protein A domain
LSFWPFGFLLSLPLGAVVIAAMILGFLGGLAAHLPKRLTAHRRAKKAEKRAAELETRLAASAPLPPNSGQPRITP